MKTNLLTEDAYKATMSPMVDVTETSLPVGNFWRYVELLVIEGVVDKYLYENELVELVYRNREETIEHVLLPTGEKNVYVVVVVDLTAQDIFGHYVLDLSIAYGLE